jgi:hypothetical protein
VVKNVLSVLNVLVVLLLAGFLVFVMMSPVALVVVLVLAVPALLARWSFRPGSGVRIRWIAALVNGLHAVTMGIWIVGLMRGQSHNPDDYGIGWGMIILAGVWMALCGTNALVLLPSLASARTLEEPGPAIKATSDLPPEATGLERWLHRIGKLQYARDFARHKVGLEHLDDMTLVRMGEIVGDPDDARAILEEIMKGSHLEGTT